ncbi:MAG: family 16 glycosylhydrolase [Pseudomonadota bacterium]
MMFCARRTQTIAASLAMVLLAAGCSDGDRTQPLADIETVPAANPTTQTNININNPTLTVASNFAVSPGDTLTLVWSDEFDGAGLDPETWFFATGDGAEVGLPSGWGNNELQYYLPDNAQLENGVLKITAKRETIEGFGYTSARINTSDRFAFQYGRIEASIKLPGGQGLWPAFWMLSQDSPYGSWAATGEIDVVEAVNLDGTNDNEIFATIHYGGEFPANTSSSVTYTPGPDVTDDFHVYAIEWDETEIRWYFDGDLYAVQNNWFSTAAPYPAPFDQPFHILLNLAVGGNFPGFSIDNDVFPATMEVDWVRVYTGEDTFIPANPGTIPDDVIYASDPGEMVDIVFGVDYTGFDPFGSGSAFDNNVTSDADFSPAFGVTTGDGYGAQVGQFAIVGFAAGFASGYGSIDFKAKGLNNDLIRVRFLDSSDYIDVTLTTSGYSTALGNGWYQVSIPIADFTAVDTATGLLFETDNTAPTSFQFLLTDIGFSGTAGGGGGGGGGGGTGSVVNGDFETGDLTGWDVFNSNGANGTVEADNTENNGGSWSVHVVAGPGQNPVIKQSFLFPGVVMPGDTVNISFDMKGSAADGGVIFPELISEESGGGAAGNLLDTIAAPSADWTTYSYSPAAGADVGGGVTFQLAIVCGGAPTCSADVFIDNVTVELN